MERALIIISYALKPGPGGAEAYVNKHFFLALYRQKKSQVFVIHGAASNARWMEELSGWTFIPYHGGQAKPQNRNLKFKIRNKFSFLRYGYGLKMRNFELEARKILKGLLKQTEKPIVYSRVLPFQSLSAVGNLKTKFDFTWLANINDPFPPDIWQATYTYKQKSVDKWKRRVDKYLSQLDAVTYPSEGIERIEEGAWPVLKTKPKELLPHITVYDDTQTRSNSLRIVYVGSLPKRNQHQKFIEALKEWHHSNKQASLEFHFYLPEEDRGSREYISQIPFSAHFHIAETEDQMKEAFRQADAFLFLGFDGDQPLLYTKLPSYVNSNKPIIGFAARNGITFQLLKGEKASLLVDLEDVGGFKAALDLLCHERSSLIFSEEKKAYFSHDSIIRRFMNLIQNLS